MKKLYFVFIFAALVAWNIDSAKAEDAPTDDVFIDEASEDDNVPPDDGGMADSGEPAPAPEEHAADTKTAAEPPPAPSAKPVAEQAPTPPADDTASSINDSFGSMESTVPLATEDESAPTVPVEKPGKVQFKHTAPVAEKKAKKQKVSVASSDGSGGFRLLKKKDCQMRRAPAGDSPVLITVKGDRKLWVEDVDSKWVKGFRKTGHGYMPKSCFKK